MLTPKTSAKESGMSSSHRRKTELGGEIVLRWRILFHSDLNHNVACTIYQYPDAKTLPGTISPFLVQVSPQPANWLQVEVEERRDQWYIQNNVFPHLLATYSIYYIFLNNPPPVLFEEEPPDVPILLLLLLKHFLNCCSWMCRRRMILFVNLSSCFYYHLYVIFQENPAGPCFPFPGLFLPLLLPLLLTQLELMFFLP